MKTETKIECPECKGSGVDTSDTPVLYVLTMDSEGTTRETPCVMCFGHGYIVAVDDPGNENK